MSDTPLGDVFSKFKSWYQSKTIIGIIIVAVSTLVQAFYPETDIAGTVGEVMNGDEVVTGVDSVWIGITQTFGLVLALYGRVKAQFGIK